MNSNWLTLSINQSCWCPRNEPDVPFDIRHVRVIYYDVNDHFGETKLIAKVAENVVAAISNPKELSSSRRSGA